MAPPRKPRHEKARPAVREFVKVRLPLDVAERIEAKAKSEMRPINRTIINELAGYPGLADQRRLGDLIRDMETILLRMGARIVWHDLSDELLKAVDAVLTSEGGALAAALDRLRVVRLAMERTERTTPRP